MEVGKAVSFDSLGLVDDDLDWNFLEILGGTEISENLVKALGELGGIIK